MAKGTKPIITICASCAFYRTVNDVQDTLTGMGFTVLVPKLATEMKQNNDYEVDHYKTWFADPNDLPKKAALMHGHFNEVAKANAILVVNEEKKGRQNYIGGNVLMEMALAFHEDKPIFVLNELPDDTPYDEELRGMMPTLLHGDVTKLPDAWKSLAKNHKA